LGSLSVTVAAYGSLGAATTDWDETARIPAVELNLIDAALIERADHRVAAIHRCSAQGWAKGSVVSAVVGMLSPPALLDGAIAGGVGRHAMTLVFTSVSRDAANELARVLDSGRFVTLAVVDRAPQPTTVAHGGRALAVATLPMGGTAFGLRHAVEADEADV
jgi:hypothetical protein